MRWGYWKPRPSAAERRARGQSAVAQAEKSGKPMQPVVIAGRAIAKTFWGKAWCDNLERYSDYDNRLPRGRSYVRSGAVIDLAIEPGKVRAQVMGSELYQVEIEINAVPQARWQALVQQCAGSIASLVELLQGRLSQAVMEHLCAPQTGLFPSPKEIRFACTCPDWASMCKHVAAALYGVGARLDEAPELLFTLRQVSAQDLLAQAAELPVETKKAPPKARVLADDELADIFGIDLATPAAAAPKKGRRGRRPAPSAPVQAPAEGRAAARRRRSG